MSLHADGCWALCCSFMMRFGVLLPIRILVLGNVEMLSGLVWGFELLVC